MVNLSIAIIALYLIDFAAGQGATYSDLGVGKCKLANNGAPTFRYHHAAGSTCEKLCTADPKCTGYSRSPDNCLVWLSGPIVAAKDAWGRAHCMKKENGIVVIKALYGTNCASHNDATAHVTAACAGKAFECAYRVNVGTLGDPAPGCAKNFVVTYRCGAGAAKTATAPPEAHDNDIMLDCRVKPTCTDTKKNGDEVKADCGGSCAEECHWSQETCEDLEWSAGNGVPEVCGSSLECVKDVDYAVAESKCTSINARLCSTAELLAGETAGTGCQFDFLLIWSNSQGSCQAGQVMLAPGNTAVSSEKPKCAPKTAKAAVRCCADKKVDNRVWVIRKQRDQPGCNTDSPKVGAGSTETDLKACQGKCKALQAPFLQYHDGGWCSCFQTCALDRPASDYGAAAVAYELTVDNRVWVIRKQRDQPGCNRDSPRVGAGSTETDLKVCQGKCKALQAPFLQYHDGGYCNCFQTCALDRPASDYGAAAVGYELTEDAKPCVGSWVPGECSQPCGTGEQTDTYKVTQPSVGNEKPCEAKDGDKRNAKCNTQDCVCDPECKNGGTCHRGESCQCPRPWLGDDCSTMPEIGCSPLPCACEPTKAKCEKCLPGWTGAYCETPPEACRDLMEACGDHGKCAFDGSKPVCACHPGWEGSKCTREATPPPTEEPPTENNDKKNAEKKANGGGKKQRNNTKGGKKNSKAEKKAAKKKKASAKKKAAKSKKAKKAAKSKKAEKKERGDNGKKGEEKGETKK